MSNSFGEFPSFAKFIENFEVARVAEERELEQGLSIAAKRERRRETRDIVEVDAKIHKREPDDVDGDKHYRLLVTLIDIIKSDTDVDADLQNNLAGQSDVFVAIRYGDRMGISEPIEGLDEGATLHLRGEWITKEKAREHGGRVLSVLHFTHHPVGFVCTVKDCFS
jgi:hypothetical protein